jgi:quinol monooxygenase YgiN
LITIRINLTARLGKERELVQAIGGLKQKIALETGCTICQVYRNTDNRNDFVVFEEWENQKSARKHLESDNLAVLVGAGSVLAQQVCVSLANDPLTSMLAVSFKERVQTASQEINLNNDKTSSGSLL